MPSHFFVSLFVFSALFGRGLGQEPACEPVNFRNLDNFYITPQPGTQTPIVGNYSGTPSFRARVDFELREDEDNNFPFTPLALEIRVEDTDALEVRFKFGGGLPNLEKRYENLNDTTIDVILTDVEDPVRSIVIVAFPAQDSNDTVKFYVDRMEGCVNPVIVIIKGDANFTTECNTDSMTVQVEVAEDFTGLVYPRGFDTNETCHYTNVSAGTYLETFLFNSTDCGANWQMEGSYWTFAVNTTVQFNKDILVDTDKSHTSECIFSNTYVIRNFVMTDVEEPPTLTESSDSSLGNVTSFLLFGILDPTTGSPLTSDSEVSVGQVIELKVQLKTNPVFSTVRMQNCRASNRAKGIFVQLELIDENGCPETDQLVLAAPRYEKDAVSGDLNVTVSVKAFLFMEGRQGNKNELHFACHARLCPAGNDSCAEPTCPSKRRRRSADELEGLVQGGRLNRVLTGGQLSRHRRAVGEGDGNVVTLAGSVQVVLDTDGQDAQVNTGYKGHYWSHPEIQAVIVVLCLLLLALIVVSITLSVLLYRRYRRRKAKVENDVMSTSSLMKKMITPTTYIPHVQAFSNPIPVYGADAYVNPNSNEGSSSRSSTKKIIY